MSINDQDYSTGISNTGTGQYGQSEESNTGTGQYGQSEELNNARGGSQVSADKYWKTTTGTGIEIPNFKPEIHVDVNCKCCSTAMKASQPISINIGSFRASCYLCEACRDDLVEKIKTELGLETESQKDEFQPASSMLAGTIILASSKV